MDPDETRVALTNEDETSPTYDSDSDTSVATHDTESWGFIPDLVDYFENLSPANKQVMETWIKMGASAMQKLDDKKAKTGQKGAGAMDPLGEVRLT